MTGEFHYQDKNLGKDVNDKGSLQYLVNEEFKKIDRIGYRDDQEILDAGCNVIKSMINEIKKDKNIVYGEWSLGPLINLHKKFIDEYNSLTGPKLLTNNADKIYQVAKSIDNAERETLERLNQNRSEQNNKMEQIDNKIVENILNKLDSNKDKKISEEELKNNISKFDTNDWYFLEGELETKNKAVIDLLEKPLLDLIKKNDLFEKYNVTVDELKIMKLACLCYKNNHNAWVGTSLATYAMYATTYYGNIWKYYKENVLLGKGISRTGNTDERWLSMEGINGIKSAMAPKAPPVVKNTPTRKQAPDFVQKNMTPGERVIESIYEIEGDVTEETLRELKIDESDTKYSLNKIVSRVKGAYFSEFEDCRMEAAEEYKRNGGDIDITSYINYKLYTFAFSKYCENINNKHKGLIKEAGYSGDEEFCDQVKLFEQFQEQMGKKYPNLGEIMEKFNKYSSEIEKVKNKYFGGKSENEIKEAEGNYTKFQTFEKEKSKEYGITKELLASVNSVPQTSEESQEYFQNLNKVLSYQSELDHEKSKYNGSIEKYHNYISGIKGVQDNYKNINFDIIKEYNSDMVERKAKGLDFDKYSKYSSLLASNKYVLTGFKNIELINGVLNDPLNEQFPISAITKLEKEKIIKQEKIDKKWNRIKENMPVIYQITNSLVGFWNGFIDATIGVGTSLGAMLLGLVKGKDNYENQLKRKEKRDNFFKINQSTAQKQAVYDPETGTLNFNLDNTVATVSGSIAQMVCLIYGGGAIGKGISKAGTKIGVGLGEKAVGKAGLFSSAFITEVGHSYTEAINSGLDGVGAFGYSMFSASIQSGLELISPNEVLLGKGIGLGKELIGNICRNGNREGLKLVGKYFLKTTGREILEENLQEGIQLAAGNLVNDMVNGIWNTGLESDWNPKNFLSTAIITTLTTGVTTGFSASRQGVHIYNSDQQQLIGRISSDPGLYEDVMKVLDNSINGNFKIPNVDTEALKELKSVLNGNEININNDILTQGEEIYKRFIEDGRSEKTIKNYEKQIKSLSPKEKNILLKYVWNGYNNPGTIKNIAALSEALNNVLGIENFFYNNCLNGYGITINSSSLYNAKFNTICNIFDSINGIELGRDLDSYLRFIEHIKNKFNEDQYSTIVNKIKNKVQNIHSTLQLPYVLGIEGIELKQYFSEKFPNAKFNIDKLCSFYTKTNIERIIKSKIILNINSEEDIEIFLQKQNIFDNDINNQRNSFNNYNTDFSDDLWSGAEYQNISEKSTDYEQKIEKLKIFWSDLLNQNLNSINESTWNIIDELKKGQSLLDKYLNNELNNSEKTELSQFLTSIHILFLHTKMDKGTWKPICEIGHEMDNIDEYLSKMDIKITALEKQLKIEKNNNSILNRLINIITNQKYNSMESLYEKKEELIKEYDNKGRLNYQKIIENGGKMPIRKGLLMNGFPAKYIENYIQSGVVGTERTRRDQDMTRFMSDFIQSYKDYNDITSLRNDVLHGLSNDGIIEEGRCIAVFSEKNQDHITGGRTTESHKTIRTGIESGEIECIFIGDSDNKLIVNKIKDMIVKHGRFIPLCDKEGNSLWTPKEFDNLKNIYDNKKGYFNGKSHKFNVTEGETLYYSKRMDGYLSQIQENGDNLPTILAQLKEDINAEYKMVTGTDQNLDLTDEQLLSVLDAHEQDGILGELTIGQLRQKVKKLAETITDPNLRRFLLEAGFCGSQHNIELENQVDIKQETQQVREQQEDLNKEKTNVERLEELGIKIPKDCKEKINMMESNSLNLGKQNINNISPSDFEILVNNYAEFPKHLITTELINNILDVKSINESRILIENFSKKNDADLFNSILKKREEQIIENIHNGNGFISKYDQLATDLENFEYNENNIENFRKILERHNNEINISLRNYLKKLFPNKSDIEGTIEYLKNTELSDIIIDYHFNDISYNVFLDIKELLNFQVSNGITIPIEHLRIYRDILNIDMLSTKQLLSLHDELNNKNVINMFYNDYTNSRDRMYQEISDSILNKEELEQFKDSKLSEQYGISVYKFDGQEFFALERESGFGLGEGQGLRNTGDTKGFSFSLVGKDCIGTWTSSIPGQRPRNAFIYEGLEPQSIMHVFPKDSWTNSEYQPRRNDNKRHIEDSISGQMACTLMSPTELLKATKEYNEIFVLRNGKDENGYGNIGEIRPIALYCYDEITPEDIEIAKSENVGIMLIKTDAYKKDAVDPEWGVDYYTEKHKYIDHQNQLNDAIIYRGDITTFEKEDELNNIINGDQSKSPENHIHTEQETQGDLGVTNDEDITPVTNNILNELGIENLNLESITHCLETANRGQLIDLFKLKEAKQIVINELPKSDFLNLLNKDYDGDLILTLLDIEGCEILSKCKNISERVNYLLTRSKAKDTLLKTDYFCDIILNNSNHIRNLNQYISDNQYFFDYVINNIGNNYRIILEFNEKEQIQLLQNLDIPIDFIKNNLTKFKKESIEWLLNNKIESIEDDISRRDFEYLVDNHIEFPKSIITPKLINRLLETKDIFQSRILIEKFSIDNDASLFNKILGKREEKIIETINHENGLLSKYDQLLAEFEKLEYNKNNIYKFWEAFEKYNIEIDHNFRKSFIEAFPNKSKIQNLIREQSNIELSDIIIDYHFNDISYNVFLDIKQLLNFQISNGVSIPVEHLKIYRDILNIDNLSVEEKIDLHNSLKEKNIVEMFYNDYSSSRDIMYQEISDSILNNNTIKEFEDKGLTEQYGVNVYKFDGQDFIGLVRRSPYTNEKSDTVGCSFSLIGTNCIGIIGGKPHSETFVYEGLEPQAIIHAYPSDSYTQLSYSIGSDAVSSHYVRTLMTPTELLNATQDYNEVLILRKGRDDSDGYGNIGEIRPIALYCYDEITPEDIEVAKRESVGIMLINTSSYQGVKTNGHWYQRDENLRYVKGEDDIENARGNREVRTSFEKTGELNDIIEGYNKN